MAIALVTSGSLLPAGINGGTSAALNTTGANCLIVSVGWYATVALSDSKGNTWVRVLTRTQASAQGCLFYCLGATVGTGHTFTLSGSGIYGAATIHAFSGVAGFQTQSGNTSPGTQPIVSGSLTPATDGALIITSLMSGGQTGETDAVTGGFTKLTTPGQSGLTLQISTGYLIQTTAAAVNPSWSWTGGTGANTTNVVSSAVFLATIAVTAPLVAATFRDWGLTGDWPGLTSKGGPTHFLNTTGATLIVISVGWYRGSGLNLVTLTDSKSNTWTPLTLHGTTASKNGHRLWYALNPTVGAGHTFTVTSTLDTWPSIAVYAFSGGWAFDTQNGAESGSSTGPLATGSITPASSGAMIVSGLQYSDGSPGAVTLTPAELASQLKIITGSAAAYMVQTTAAAINPSWGYSGGTTQGAAVSVASFTTTIAPTAIRVTQAAIEALTSAPAAAVVTQYALETLIGGLGGGRWKLTIAGTDRTAIVDSFSYTFVLNERGRASLVLADFLPEKFQEVVSYAKNGFTPLFGGVILTRAFTGRNQYDSTFQVTCECGDWFTYADWATISKIYDAPVSLKAVLQDLVTDALGVYGITLHTLQVDGPNLAPFLWRGTKVSDALRELSERTKYVAVITPAKALRMFFPGTDSAPVAMTEAMPHAQELSWTDSDRAGGAPINKVTVICGPTGQREVHDERHYGDGVTRVWPLYAPFVAVIGALHIYSEMAGGYPLARCGIDFWEPEHIEYPYCYNAADNTIHQREDQPVIVAGDYFWLWYLAEFPFEVSAATGEEPVIELTESRTDVLSIPAGQEIANGLLAQFGGSAGGEDRELAITTDEDGFEVGQALTVDLPTTRSVSGEFVITELAMTIVLDTDQGDAYWQYTLKASKAAATAYQGSYLDDWRRIVVSPSIVTEVQAEETRTKNVHRTPKPDTPIYPARYVEPGVAIFDPKQPRVETRPKDEPKE